MKKIILLTAILPLSGCAARDEMSTQETQPAFYDTASSVIEESQPAISDTASSETDDISEQTRWVIHLKHTTSSNIPSHVLPGHPPLPTNLEPLNLTVLHQPQGGVSAYIQ